MKARPRQEQMAGGALRSVFGVESYAPRIRFRRNTRRGPVWFVEALFPGYLFARFNYGEEHRKVRYAAGVAGFVQFGERIAAVEEESMGELRSLVRESGCVSVDSEPRPGGWVEIAGGVFSGWEGLVKEALPSRERVKLLLEFFGLTVEVDVQNGCVLRKR